MIDERYPIGTFHPPATTSMEDRELWIRQIGRAPGELRDAVDGLSEEQLETPYRDSGWSVRQVVHHLPDSHMNGYARMKLALTEDRPLIKPYDEARWAELADAKSGPIETSLTLLEALHERWVRLLESLTEADYARTLQHPESGVWRMDQWLAEYAWHGRHHIAHITALRDRLGW